MKNIISDFKKFALKNNVFDMAIGVVIGAAFSKIVSSFVADITPLTSLITKKELPSRTSSLFLAIRKVRSLKQHKLLPKAGFPTMNYGIFFQNVIDFFIIAISVYIAVRLINKSRKDLSMRFRW